VFKQTGSWILSVIAGGALAAVLGLMLEIGFLRRLYKHPTDQVLLTIGFIHIIENISHWIWGGFPVGVPVPGLFYGSSVVLGNVGIPAFRFFIIGFGILMAVLLWLLQDKTRIGAVVRAGMDNREVAGALGLNVRLLFTAIFVLGSAIAGISSMIGGTLTGINMATGWEVLLNSIIVVVIGGTGSIQGALLGGVIIGLVNAFGTAYFPDFASFIIYFVLIIILLIKPSGLLGRKMDVNRAVEGAASADAGKGRHRTSHEAVLPLGANKLAVYAGRWAPYLFVLLILVVLPNFIGTYTQSMMTRVLIYALFAMSLDVVMGYAGLPSFGHAAFFGMGGYAVGLLATQTSISSFWILLLLTLLICAALSAVIGYFTLRLSDTYFLMVTMAFGQLLYVVATKWYTLTGGTDGLNGIPHPDLGFSVNWTSGKVYYFTLVIFLICYYLLSRFMRSSFGRALLGVRENEGRMRCLGFNTWALKYCGVIIAGVFAGVSGLLYAYAYGTMVPGNFALETSALPMLMVIMGGHSTLWGPAFAAMAIVLVQNYAGIYMPDRWPLVLGVLYVLCVMFLRGGFARYLTDAWDWVCDRVLSGNKALPEPVAGKTQEGS
jgi:branched-chain amino acid transport system permease protein